MVTKVLTVGDLAGTSSLGIRVLAGAGGLGREVLWAHSCEMEHPARWLGPHELLMTVGLCVPADDRGQVGLLASLDEAGLAGVVVGDHNLAPDLSPAMLAEADRRNFPLLLADPQTPFAVVARHVAAANSSAQTLQVLKLSKLYHLTAQAGNDAQALVAGLAVLLRVDITVVEALTGLILLASPAERQARGGTESRAYPLRGRHCAQLQIVEHRGEELDSFLLVHLLKVMEVTVDQMLAAVNARAEVSDRLMVALLDGTAGSQATEHLAPHLPLDGFQLLAFSSSEGASVARALAIEGLPVIVGAGRTCHLALAPVAVVPACREVLSKLVTHVGVSSIFRDYVDTNAAAAEAGRVLEAAAHSSELWAEFKGSTVAILTRSHREAIDIVTGVLGPLAEGSTRSTSLRDTLFAYLRNDRRWSETAAELSIHRQTLSYRLRRITEETGLSTTKSSDLSALWLAYQAWTFLHSNSSDVLADG